MFPRFVAVMLVAMIAGLGTILAFAYQPVGSQTDSTGVTRSISASRVEPGGTVDVTITLNSGLLVDVTETLPAGWSYQSVSPADTTVMQSGQDISFEVIAGQPVTYTAMAPAAAARSTFSGTYSVPAGASNVAIGGDTTVTTGDPPEATRSFSPAEVAPGGIVTVTIAHANTGGIGRVTEMIPSGFTYSSSSLSAGNVDTSNMAAPVFNLFEAGPSFTYDVTAPMTEGDYTFSGTLRAGSPLGDYAVGGAATVTVRARDPLVARYDTNNNDRIDRSEVIAAIKDYLSGDAQPPITRADVIKLINIYLSGPT